MITGVVKNMKFTELRFRLVFVISNSAQSQMMFTRKKVCSYLLLKLWSMIGNQEKFYSTQVSISCRNLFLGQISTLTMATLSLQIKIRQKKFSM